MKYSDLLPRFFSTVGLDPKFVADVPSSGNFVPMHGLVPRGLVASYFGPCRQFL